MFLCFNGRELWTVWCAGYGITVYEMSIWYKKSVATHEWKGCNQRHESIKLRRIPETQYQHLNSGNYHLALILSLVSLRVVGKKETLPWIKSNNGEALQGKSPSDTTRRRRLEVATHMWWACYTWQNVYGQRRGRCCAFGQNLLNAMITLSYPSCPSKIPWDGWGMPPHTSAHHEQNKTLHSMTSQQSSL